MSQANKPRVTRASSESVNTTSNQQTTKQRTITNLDNDNKLKLYNSESNDSNNQSSIMNSSLIMNSNNQLSSTNNIRIGSISSKGRFPMLKECEHFHYEIASVETPKNFQAIVLSENDHNENDVSLNSSTIMNSNNSNLKTLCINNDEQNNYLFHIKVSSNDKIWIISRTYENFRYLDKQLHECIFDRKYSNLQPIIEPLKEQINKDNCKRYKSLFAHYLNRFCEIAFVTPVINCGPILNWFEIDNKGNRLYAIDESQPINIPGVAAALVKKRYVAQCCDEISLEVSDMISVIDMPPIEESLWWRGKNKLEVGFFPCECVELIRNNESLPNNVGMPQLNNQQSVRLKHGKLITLLRTFFNTRPTSSQLVYRRILKYRVFGCDLGEHLIDTGKEVPEVVRLCTEFIETNGLVDGIYRHTGSQSNIQKLRIAFDEQRFEELNQETYLNDVHSVSSLLKMYFRELPNPLLTYQLYDKFCKAAKTSDKIAEIHDLVQQLPPPHYRTLVFLMRHLHSFSRQASKTNMNTKNLAIVWAPNLLKSPATAKDDEMLYNVSLQANIAEFLIANADVIFDDKFSSLNRKNDGKTHRPISVCHSTGSNKLISLEEARDKYKQVGPVELPKYHAIIDLSAKDKKNLEKKKSKSKSRKGKSPEINQISEIPTNNDIMSSSIISTKSNILPIIDQPQSNAFIRGFRSSSVKFTSPKNNEDIKNAINSITNALPQNTVFPSSTSSSSIRGGNQPTQNDEQSFINSRLRSSSTLNKSSSNQNRYSPIPPPRLALQQNNDPSSILLPQSPSLNKLEQGDTNSIKLSTFNRDVQDPTRESFSSVKSSSKQNTLSTFKERGNNDISQPKQNTQFIYENKQATADIQSLSSNNRTNVSYSNDDLSNNENNVQFPTPPPPIGEQSPNRFQAQDLRLSTSPLSTSTGSRSSNSPISPINDNELLIINEDMDNDNDNSYDNQIYLNLVDFEPQINEIEKTTKPKTKTEPKTLSPSLRTESLPERVSFGFKYDPEADKQSQRRSDASFSDKSSPSPKKRESLGFNYKNDDKTKTKNDDHDAPFPLPPASQQLSYVEQTDGTLVTQNNNKRKSDVIVDVETGESLKQHSAKSSPTKQIAHNNNNNNETEVNQLNVDITNKLQIETAIDNNKSSPTNHVHQDGIECLYCKISRSNSVKKESTKRQTLPADLVYEPELHHHKDDDNCVYCRLKDGKKLTKSESLNINRPKSSGPVNYTDETTLIEDSKNQTEQPDKDQIRIDNRNAIKSPSSDDILKPKYNQLNTIFRQEQSPHQQQHQHQHPQSQPNINTEALKISTKSPNPLARSKSIASPNSVTYLTNNTNNVDSQSIKFSIKKTKPIYQLIEKQSQQSNQQSQQPQQNQQSVSSDGNISNDENLSSSSKENIDDLTTRELNSTSKRKCSINLDELKRRKSEDEQQKQTNNTSINSMQSLGTSLPTSIESTILKFNSNNTNRNNQKTQSLQDTTRFSSLRISQQPQPIISQSQSQQQAKSPSPSQSQQQQPVQQLSSQDILNNEINVKAKVKLMESKTNIPAAETDNSATTVIQLQQTTITAAKPTTLFNKSNSKPEVLTRSTSQNANNKATTPTSSSSPPQMPLITRQVANNVFIVETSVPSIIGEQTSKSLPPNDQSKDDMLIKQREKRQTVKELLSKFEHK